LSAAQREREVHGDGELVGREPLLFSERGELPDAAECLRRQAGRSEEGFRLRALDEAVPVCVGALEQQRVLLPLLRCQWARPHLRHLRCAAAVAWYVDSWMMNRSARGVVRDSQKHISLNHNNTHNQYFNITPHFLTTNN
jgi:hypothetical protein